MVQPAPAPRFSRTEADVPHGSRHPGQDSRQVLQEVGYSDAEIEELFSDGVVVQA